MRYVRSAAVATATLVGTLVTAAGPAAASPNQDVFDANDNTWACEAEGALPPSHCLNVRSNGNTGVIKVFEPDTRGPQESISFDPKSDSRPCPHDPGPDPAQADGTWWSPFPGAWVCHHRP